MMATFDGFEFDVLIVGSGQGVVCLRISLRKQA